MKRLVKNLLNKSFDSLLLSIELFNRPSNKGRIHSVLILMDHSFEMLLKASIIHKGGKIISSKKNETIGFSACVRKSFSNDTVKFLKEDEVLTLQTINGLRDAAQHYTLNISEEHLYFQAQSGLTLFRDITIRVFNIDLKDKLPERVLPISTIPPTDINNLFINEIESVKKLIEPNKRKKSEAMERLRSIAIMENAVQGSTDQPSDHNLKKIISRINTGHNLRQLFPGVASLNFTTNGFGPSLDLRITRQEGIPVHIIDNENPNSATLAIKRVNELDYYSLGRNS